MHRFGLCLRIALIGAALAGMAGMSGCAFLPFTQASSPSVQQAPDANDGATPVTPPANTATTAVTTVAELQDLIKGRKVNELRTTYNGAYGASLLFRPDNLTYYVALFQQRDFWQVVKTTSVQQADSIYRVFADRTIELAQVDFERIRLQAENTKAEQQLNTRMSRLNTLQADHALRLEQDKQVASRQAQLTAEADRLNQQQQDIQAQLRDMQRQIEALQAENGSLLAVNKAWSSTTTARPPVSSAKKPVSTKRPAKPASRKKVIPRRTDASTSPP